MKKSGLKVALKMSKLSVPDKINTATTYVKGVISNPNVFTNSNALTASVTNAINVLETAWKDAQDGGKTKTAIMHDKEDTLMKMMFDLAHYVESIANGDAAIVHLCGMDVKHFTPRQLPEFEVKQGNTEGAVTLRVKVHKRALYKWQYSVNPENQQWVTGDSTYTSKTVIGELTPGTMYWFRVIIITNNGETVVDPMNFVVH